MDKINPDRLENLAARLDRPIVLVGMMGVGKTSLGKRLAQALQLPFIDADAEIELAAKMTIPEIFDTYGEAYFRDGERRVIARLINEKPQVIATGGGAFCHADTRRLILTRAIAVWLDAEIPTLLRRVSRKDNRPLLKQGDPREILSRLRNERRAFYAEAPIHIISDDGPHDAAINTVIKAIDSWL